MNLLIIGAGAREHALAWKVSTSPKLTNLYVFFGKIYRDYNETYNPRINSEIEKIILNT